MDGTIRFRRETVSSKNFTVIRPRARVGGAPAPAANTSVDAFGAPAQKQVDVEELQLAAQRMVGSVVFSRGFEQLQPEEQTKLRTLISGSNRALSLPARYAASRLTQSETWRTAQPVEQGEMLRRFLREENFLEPLLAGIVETQRQQPSLASYTLTEPTVSEIPSGSSTIQLSRYELLIDGRRILFQVESPQRAGLVMHSAEEVARAFASLPKSCRDVVQRLYVSGAPNSMDAYWAQQYNQPNFKTYMTAGAGGMINIFPLDYWADFDTLSKSMLHEVGHILSQRAWGRGDSERWTPWRQAAASDGLHASTYAKASIEEDFSETLVLYMNVKSSPDETELRRLMPQRFRLLDELLQGTK